jgi:ATP-dependent helicase/nuclease subunit A
MTSLATTLAAQREAADPKLSAFVAANAGAGKTKVLTERVARLLLAGAAPERILCITYTKAAAAEMADRLFKLLGGWAMAEDAKLRDAIAQLEGVAPDPAFDFGAARRLFARALETPGGLKIQTIHAFCENVLRRFPLEAGVAPGFAVLTEDDARRLAGEALEETIVAGAVASSLARLASLMAPPDLRALLIDGLVSRRKWERTPPPARRRFALAAALGIDPQTDEAAALAAAAKSVSDGEMERAQNALRLGGETAQGFANGAVAQFLGAADAEARVAALAKLFFKSDGAVREKFGDRQTKAASPWLEPFLLERAANFAKSYDAVRAAVALADSLAYGEIVGAALAVYDRKKAEAAALDFDDLIGRAGRLMSSAADAAWVLYKLDQGVDHILLDEAQDTSPSQWGLLESLLAEMTAGEGARGGGRTFFAVGDQKQSIYAFQGADAALFDQKRADLGKKIAAVATFKQPELALSFRSTWPVLRFVDALFADAEARNGLVALDARIEHGVERQGHAGRVEIWPLEPRPDKSEPQTWEAPVDSIRADDPIRRLTERVAREIAGWVGGGAILASSGRPIAPGDVLILVQARSALFHEMIRALSVVGLPVAGADRMEILKETAVADLIAYARAALIETDDLSLAETLKSPFFGWSDEDLFRIAYARRGSLWRALEDDASAAARLAREEIAKARRIALAEGAFAFFMHALESGAPHSGRKRLYARLGGAQRDAIDELLRQALDFELTKPRSLSKFLAWFSAAAGEVKREMGEAGAAIRVMTVHGAKGLEAPIVFLLDAHRIPNPRPTTPLLDLPADPVRASAPLFAFARAKADDCAALAAARARWKALDYEEYRRKLYVAATRARDRLYVCGVESGVGDPAKKAVGEASWHSLALAAADRAGGAKKEPHTDGAVRIVLEAAQTVPSKPFKENAAPAAGDIPTFLSKFVSGETPPRRIQPSRLAAEEGDDGSALAPGAGAFLRGRSIHRLLELLPEVEPARRRDVADRILAHMAPATPQAERAGWRDEAVRVLEDEAFGEVFSGRGRAEAAIAGRIATQAGPVIVNGAIDRLAVLERRVLIVDYKTNRPPPARIEEAPSSYVAQLAAYRALLQQIYPAHEIACALLWTYAPRLMPVPPLLLDHALRSALG